LFEEVVGDSPNIDEALNGSNVWEETAPGPAATVDHTSPFADDELEEPKEKKKKISEDDLLKESVKTLQAVAMRSNSVPSTQAEPPMDYIDHWGKMIVGMVRMVPERRRGQVQLDM